MNGITLGTLDGLVLIGALIVVGLGLALYLRSKRPPAGLASDSVARSLGDLGSLRSSVEALASQQLAITQTLNTLQSAVLGVETRVVQSSAGMQEAIGRQLQEARVAMERLKADAEARQRLDDELQASTRRIETVLLGTHSRGVAGENIVQDALRELPPEMVEANFRVNGKVVEFALILANAKRLPLDSKWPSVELLERLCAAAGDPGSELQVVADVERLLRTKVRDVRQYIDPAVTLSFAIAAVPDPIFSACRRVHLEAYRESVVLLPYSMTLPYVLTLFRMHLQYARSVDLENLDGYLQQIEDNVNGLERSLENSISRGSIMIQNAFNECKRNVGQMRGALAALRAAPLSGVGLSLALARDVDGDRQLPTARVDGDLQGSWGP